MACLERSLCIEERGSTLGGGKVGGKMHSIAKDRRLRNSFQERRLGGVVLRRCCREELHGS